MRLPTLTRGSVSRGDVAVAAGTWLVAVTVLLVVEPLAAGESGGRVPGLGTLAWWGGLAVVTAQAVGLLLLRRPRPGLALVVVAAGEPLGAAAGLGDALGVTSVAVLVAVYVIALGGRVRRDAWALGAAVLLVAVGFLVARPADAGLTALVAGGGLLQAAGTVALALVVGLAIRAPRETAAARAREVEALAREQGARIEAALARERAAMARELHDIAAHHLSGIAMMTGAIVGQIDADPEAAKASVRRVRGETTAMLGELRSLVHLLRDPDAAAPEGGSAATGEAGARTGVETLASVPALVERARAAGLDASLTIPGADPAPDARPPGADAGPLAQLAAYRTVQESLANAVRHAPGARCEVVLDARDPATLLFSVRNGPPGAPAASRPPDPGRGGLGLIGMRERADLTGARLEVGPQPDGGWLVALAIPRHADAAPAPRPNDTEPAAGPTPTHDSPTPGAPA